MTIQEIVTMIDENLPVKMAIMNNWFLGMVRQWQELFYDNNYVSVNMSQPDFVKLGEAYGIKSIRVTDKSEVDAVIKEANEHSGPVLIDFQVETEGNVWPMVPAGAALNETVETSEQVKAL